MSQATFIDFEIYRILVIKYGYNLKRIDLGCVASMLSILKHGIINHD